LSIELGILFGAISLAIGFSTFFIGRQSAAKTAGKDEGQLLAKLEFLSQTVARIERIVDRIQTAYQEDLKEQRQHFESEMEKLRTETAESIRRLHARIDELNKGH
jgi:hypothetical protein